MNSFEKTPMMLCTRNQDKCIENDIEHKLSIFIELIAGKVTKGNLIYLALTTERIPIIPKFLSNHIDPSAPPFEYLTSLDSVKP
ncbi:hypothetical protein BDR06DRAFT_1015588 [Suillus hirtellus]|nr:hypothetical protein BDR06DRAFT_1015588 [Suillus hirtellus]